MSTTLQYTLDNTNQINNTLYTESYGLLSRVTDIDTRLEYLIAKQDVIDRNFIPHSIDTIYKEAFRKYLTKKGIMVVWDTSLRDLLAIADMTIELSNHSNIVDILQDISKDDFELSMVLSRIDIESINLIEQIESYDLYRDNLYKTNIEQILS